MRVTAITPIRGAPDRTAAGAEHAGGAAGVPDRHKIPIRHQTPIREHLDETL